MPRQIVFDLETEHDIQQYIDLVRQRTGARVSRSAAVRALVAAAMQSPSVLGLESSQPDGRH